MKKTKQVNLLLYTIKMIFMLFLVLMITSLSGSFIYLLTDYSKYRMMLLGELVMALVMLIIMLLSGNKYVFTEKREKFAQAIKRGKPMLILSLFFLFMAIATLVFEQKSFNIYNFISLLLLTVCIGVFEEFFCRGWLQNEFIERFGKNKKGIIISIIISSLFFGLIHLTNVLSGQPLFQTIMQVIQTTAIGFLFGTIYFRTKNIWACVFLHGFYDFSLMLSDINYLKEPVTTGGELISIVSSIFISVFWIFSAIKLLQKSDFNQVSEYIEELEEIDIIQENKNRKLCNVIMIISIVGLCLATLFIPDDSVTIEYNYETKEISGYTLHYASYDKYYVNYNDITLSISDNGDYNIIIKNLKTNDEVVLDYEVIDYEFIDNTETYGILIYTSEGTYYAELDKNNITNDLEYLQNIKNRFKKYDVPELYDGGYITIENDNKKYPFLKSVAQDVFIIMEDNIYLVK